jgi:hypothetical protein
MKISIPYGATFKAHTPRSPAATALDSLALLFTRVGGFKFKNTGSFFSVLFVSGRLVGAENTPSSIFGMAGHFNIV